MPQPEKTPTESPPPRASARDMSATPATPGGTAPVAPVPGAMPENAGHDPGDANRTVADVGKRDREIVAFLNRLIMLEQQSVAIKEDVLAREHDEATASRLRAMIDEDKRAIEVAERTIRDLDGHVSQFRKTGGFLVGKARAIVEDIPARARAAIESRDLAAMRESPPSQRLVDYTDAYVAELAGHAHWQILKRIAETTSVRAVLDAVSEREAVADAHRDYFQAKAQQVAREVYSSVGSPRI